MNIDIFITSASRPKHLKKVLESLNIYLHINEHNIRWVIVEDVCNGKLSGDVIRLTKYFDKRYIVMPSKGMINSIKTYLEQAFSDYTLKLVDDMILYRHIDLDYYIGIMEKYKNINQLIFNKRVSKNSQIHKDLKVTMDMEMVPCKKFSSMNSIWRTMFVKELWPKIMNEGDRNIHNISTNLYTYFKKKEIGRKDFVSKLGSYYPGSGEGEYCFFKHIGTNISRMWPHKNKEIYRKDGCGYNEMECKEG